LPLLLWSAICALFFGTLLLGMERLPTGDFTAQFHTFGLFQAQELAHGRLPLWLPATYAGARFVGDPQAAAFYLPRLLTTVASLPGEFSLYLLQLEAIGHVWLAGVFTYALAWSITKQPLAALLAAVAFGLGGYLTSYPILQLAILETIAWLPLALFLLREGVLRSLPGDRPALGWLLGAALVLALSLTAGHPQTFLHAGYVAGLYFLYQSWRARWSWTAVLGVGALMAAMVVLASAAMWMPALQTWVSSTRSAVSYEFVSSGQPMFNYLQAITPASLAFWSPEYAGIAVLALVLLLWLDRGELDRRERSESLFWAALALLAAWLALGESGGLFQLLYRAAPGFSLFRQQERLLGVVSLSLALLAAQGLAVWLRMAMVQTPGRRRQIGVVALSLVAILALAAVALFAAGALAVQSWPQTALRQLLVIGLVYLILAPAFRPRAQVVALVLLLALDLYTATFSGINRRPESPFAFWQHPPWLEVLLADYQAAGVSRLDSTSTFFGNYGAVYGWEDIRGISPIKPAALAALEEIPLARRWQLLNVSHVITIELPEGAQVTKIADLDQNLAPDASIYGSAYRIDKPTGRAWMSYSPIQAENEQQALALLADPAIDLTSSVVFHTAVPELALEASAESPAVEVSVPEPGRRQIAVNTALPGFLVVSEWYEPGWWATVDGEPADIYPADYALQAIYLPAGNHEVVLEFKPPEVGLGIAVSLLTVVAAVLIARLVRRPIAERGAAGRLAGVAVPRLSGVALPGSAAGKRFWLWAMVLLTLLSFGLRVFRVDTQELRGDEAFSYLFARLPAAEIVPALLAEGDPHSPLHYFALHAVMGLVGDSELALRLLSFVAGVLAIPLMFQLGRRVEGRSFGFLVAALATVSTSLIWISQDVRNQYVLALTLSLAATLILLRLEEKPTIVIGTLYCLACALTIYAHYYGLFALAAHALYLLTLRPARRVWLTWLVSFGAALLLFLPWALAVGSATLAAGQLNDPSQPELAAHIMSIGSELVAGPVWRLAQARWLFLGLGTIAVAGFAGLWRKNRPMAVLLGSWLILTILGIYLVRLRRSTFNDFYITVAAPAWWALVGAGVWRLKEQGSGRGRAVVYAAVLVTIVFALVGWGRYYFLPEYSRTRGYREIARTLAAEAEGGDLFLAHFPDPTFDYYLRDVPLPRTMQPATFPAEEQETNEAMAELADSYSRLWFVPARQSNWDPTDSVWRWLDYHALLEKELQQGSLILSAYRPLAHVEEVMTPIGRMVGEDIRLEHGYLTIDGAPVDLSAPISSAGVSPGATLEASFVWETLKKPERDLTVSVYLLDEQGRLVAQHDGTPATGTRPMTSWLPSERILDKHRIILPESLPAGGGTLLVSMYDPATLERVPFSNGDTAWKLVDLTFETPGP